MADRAARIPLAPLSPEAVAVLATEHGADPEGLYRKTNGNPFFVTELLAAGTDLPETLRDAVPAAAQSACRRRHPAPAPPSTSGTRT